MKVKELILLLTFDDLKNIRPSAHLKFQDAVLLTLVKYY